MPNNLPLADYWKVLSYLVRNLNHAISWKVEVALETEQQMHGNVQ